MIIGISSAIFSSKFNCDDNHFHYPAHRYLIIILIYSSVQLCSDKTLLVIIILMIAIIFLFASFQNIRIYSLNQFCLHQSTLIIFFHQLMLIIILIVIIFLIRDRQRPPLAKLSLDRVLLTAWQLATILRKWWSFDHNHHNQMMIMMRMMV